MSFVSSPGFKIYALFWGLVFFCCAPIWANEYFINQDGSAHLYTSYLMLEILKSNANVADFYAFNSFSIPNSSGHWLMVWLLLLFQPLILTKLMMTLVFSGFVASIGWLRRQAVGAEGIKTSILIGAALGFNWLWFVGFYNFLIGVCCFILTVGLFFKWRENLNIWKTLIFSCLFLLTYFSHIVSFVILFGSLFILVFSSNTQQIKRNLIFMAIALLPVLPFLIIYKTLTADGGGFFPVWRNLHNIFSVSDWLSQIRTADLFIIISRKSFPFVSAQSNLFAIFTPVLWISAAFFALLGATYFEKRRVAAFTKSDFIFAFLLVSLVLAAMFSPDDFGLNNGSVLRERILLCGLIFIVPIFRVNNSIKLKRFAQTILVFVIIFQTLAVWDYSIQTNLVAGEFFAAQNSIPPDEKLASVVMIDEDLRFHSIPLPMLNNYFGLSSNRIVLDNYEIGHYLFPLVAKNKADKEFIYCLTRFNSFSPELNGEKFDEKLSDLEGCLAENNQKINTLVFWGKNQKVENIIAKWFESKPYFENGRVRLFHHK